MQGLDSAIGISLNFNSDVVHMILLKFLCMKNY
jgi:hypothetical protein